MVARFKSCRVESSVARFEQLKSLAVAAALEEVAKLRVDLRRQGLFEAIDFFGDFAEAGGVAVGFAASFFVGDDGKGFAEDGGGLG